MSTGEQYGASETLNHIYCRPVDTGQVIEIAGLTDDAGAHDFVKLGFTGLVADEGIGKIPDQLRDSTLDVISESALDSGFDLNRDYESDKRSAANTWSALEPLFGTDSCTFHDGTRPTTLLLQLSVPLLPVISVTNNLLPGSAEYYSEVGRAQRELLRSLTFWRTRNHIDQSTPRLVHAGDDGLLIFVVDSWLVAINQNPEEASIDIGEGGNMWLMLGTDRDVHLHGSLLVLPADSGAILANELAR